MAHPAATPETIEGMLLAHRKVLAALTAAVLEGGGAATARLARLAETDGVPADHQEDPGAVPSGAFAIEAALAEELRLVAVEVERLRKAMRPA